VTVETGDVACDVLADQRGALPDVCDLMPDGAESGYAFATLHRAELTDSPALLLGVLAALGRLPVPVVLAIHPRTVAALSAAGHTAPAGGRLRVVPAVGYRESAAARPVYHRAKPCEPSP